MNAPAARADATVPAPVFPQLHRALAELALASGPRAPLAQQTVGRHLAFLPPEALELDLDDPAQRDFGDYELIEKLGQGGMGVVYRARQVALDREVAVKLLAAGPWASRDFIERFRREAQSAARMQHPGIVSIFEVGAHDDLNYFSMQLVRGESLASLLAREGQQSPRRAAALLRTIAEAVDYAHSLGVLHLDLKPGNVLIDERGEPQVADFGLARRLDDTLAADSDEVSGTPSYMAPEQAVLRSHKLSPATDVYGLGAILYELLTGRPPFLGANPQATLQRVVEGAVEPPRRLVPALPADLEAICLKCLAKDPAERYRDARALAADLAAFLDDRPVSVRPLGTLQRLARAARREPRIAALAASLMLALASGLVATTWQARRASANADAAGANAARANATAWAQRRDLAWREFDARRGFNALPLLVDNLREQEALGATAEAALDRRRLGTLLASGPVLIDVLRVHPAPEERMHGGTSMVSLTPDGDTLLVGYMPGGAAAVDVASGEVRWRRDIGILRGLRDPIVTLHGGEVAAGICDSSNPVPGCQTRMDLASGELLPPLPGFEDAVAMRFSPDARFAVLQSSKGERQLWRTDPWRAASPRQPPDGLTLALVASDGSAVYFTAQGDTLLTDGAGTRRRLALVQDQNTPAWLMATDRSGHYLAVPWGNSQIAVIDLGTLERRLLPNTCQAQLSVLEFSSDDQWLAVGCDDGVLRIRNVASGQEVAAPIRHPGPVDRVESHAGSRLARVYANGENYQWQLPALESPRSIAVPATPSLAVAGESWATSNAFDPGSGLLAVGSNDGRIKLWRLRAPPLLPGAAPPLASQGLLFDGRHAVMVEATRARVHDVVQRRDVSIVFEHPQPVAHALLAPDGATLVVASGREVHAWDWRGGQARLPPRRLPATPAWVEVDRAGGRLLVAWFETEQAMPRLSIEVLDLADGRTLAAAAVAADVVDLRIDGDDHVLLRRHRTVEALRLADLSVLHPPRSWPGVDGAPSLLTDARLGQDELWATTKVAGVTNATAGSRDGLRMPKLVRWPPTGTPTLVGDVTGFNQRIALRGDGALAFAAELPNTPLRHVLRAPDGGLTWMVESGDAFNHMALAFSADATLLARGLEDGAIVADATTGAPLSPPLRAALDPGDLVTQLAFAPDNEGLLARTEFGHWIYWSIAPDRRPLATIARHAALLSPPRTVLFFEQVEEPDAAMRKALRATDRGAIDLRRQLPRPADTARSAQGHAAEAHFVDLAPWRTQRPRGAEPASTGLLPASVPRGRQRLDGIEFEIGDFVQLGMPAGIPDVPVPPLLAALERVPLPANTARLHLLLGDFRIRNYQGPVATVVLHYRDGGSYRQVLAFPHPHSRRLHYAEPLAQIDAAAAAGANLAWVGRAHDTARYQFPTVPLYRLSVENPEPGRAVAAFSLLPGSHPVLVAATAEPAGAAMAP
ncbi:MAG TPA: protein kinase [Pseudomonadota bacterium]|nr:protein kinase [Pseudomonadota bacterium]